MAPNPLSGARPCIAELGGDKPPPRCLKTLHWTAGARPRAGGRVLRPLLLACGRERERERERDKQQWYHGLYGSSLIRHYCGLLDRDRSFGQSVVFCCMERRWLGCIRYIGRVDIVIFISLFMSYGCMLLVTCTSLAQCLHITWTSLAHHLHVTCTSLARHLHVVCTSLACHLRITSTSLEFTFTSLARYLHVT